MSRPEGMYVGELTDPTTHQRTGEAVGLDPDDFTTHGVIVGMTGSGKTGLGIVLLEEALTKGVPTIIIDPKGDMGNLLLTFPNLAPTDFAPWVPAGEDAAQVAQTWTSGLADWGMAATDIATLRTGHKMTVYTPGSTAGVPLNIIGSLAPPAGSDAESMHDEVESLVQGLLGLIGVTSDPLSGREHVLMANIVETAWAAGETIDLPTLLMRIQDPPMRKLGVIDVESFFPKDDRVALMMRLNGLLASPSFSAWGQGAPIDIDQMLWSPDGSANAAVVYLAHLSDEERQMVVTRLLSKLVGWMRGQQGSTKLRVFVYMDEVYGFVPPSAMPPSKKPLLTLFKQARAFGVGVVLATQNPVDLDYKAISNAGTWMIGRLQTERDKARLLEGMSSAAGTVDLAATDATISALAKREFLLHTTGGKPPRTFGVRWAMSYLCGPLSKDQIRQLPGEADAMAPATNASADAPISNASADAPAAPSATSATPAAPATPTAPPAPTLADDETPAMPEVAEGIAVRHLSPSTPWVAEVGATIGAPRLQAGIAVRVSMLFDDTTADISHTETWEAIYTPLGESFSADGGTPVDYDDRDLVTEQPSGSRFVLPTAPIKTKSYFTGVETDVKHFLVRNHRTSVLANKELKLFSRPGEDESAFRARCTTAADSAADADADKIRARLAPKIDRLKDDIDEAQQRAAQLEEEKSSSRTTELLQVGGSVLGALFGGRRSVSSITSAVGRASTGRARTQKAANRMEQALGRVEEKSANLTDLEDQLKDELADIQAHWTEVAGTIETLDIPLEKADIKIEQIALVWLPTA